MTKNENSKTTKLVIIIAALILYGCNTISNVDQVHNQIHYIKDERTGLCFGVIHFGGYNTTGLSMASVPCSPEVTRFLEHGK